MTDDANRDDLEPEEGKVLPQREMMSLITPDPADPGLLIPGGPYETSVYQPPGDTLPVQGPDTAPVQGPDTEGGTDADTATTVSDTDTASAG